MKPSPAYGEVLVQLALAKSPAERLEILKEAVAKQRITGAEFLRLAELPVSAPAQESGE